MAPRGRNARAGRARAVAARLLLGALIAAALGVASPAPAPASCVGPQLTVQPRPYPSHPEPQQSTAAAPAVAPTTLGSPTRVFRLQSLVVTGVWFRNGCADSFETSGCSGPRPVDPETPMRGVVLTLSQGSRSWTLGTADASGPSRQFSTRWEVALPDGVSAGPATLVAGTAKAPIDVWR